ncbi:protein GRAVITROPIC IN THE LIGHT 1-like [Cucurbita maxima]|uniref:Protein GRAVITROPIC IN THE LIGHT 1-like n=1 Tax=Cucurbita maxima TaxID=3661 RepID=A0A6J1J087_CUCMA|nr:protein GRAVITROPIC IN THE LIGHT 1-like [Cucurbita maxima]XP_022980764.1 protein GRAVITROPIC IN THE LIGHT 1-like [Cucurbita maxima]
MDSVKPAPMSSKKTKLARTFAKVLHIRMLTGVSPIGGTPKGDRTVAKNVGKQSGSFDCSDEDQQDRAAMEAFLAKLFATTTALKAAYAQLQYAQSPFDVDGIQAADRTIVSELKRLSELKRCFVKKQFDLLPENAMLLAELLEQKSVVKIYEVSVKKMNSQVRLKDSEIIFLKEKLEEAKSNNKILEKRMNQSGSLFMLENLQLSAINTNHFARVLRQTVKTVTTFVELLIDEMKSAGWDIGEAASAIEPDVVYFKDEHKRFAFEAFVCRIMFEGFHFPNFGLPNESLPEKQQQKKLYFRRFTEAKSLTWKELIDEKPKSTFAKFYRAKYLQLIHQKMESSLFGNMKQRRQVSSGEIPESEFFGTFADMARWVWLLHCLAFSFDSEASIFQVSKGCRFNEVYTKAVTEEVLLLSTEPELRVAFTVVPGFKIGKTVIQCQVYISKSQQQQQQQQQHQLKQPVQKKTEVR